MRQLTDAEAQRAPVAQAAGAPSGPRRRRGDRVLSQVQALSDAGGDPPEGRPSFSRRSVRCSSSTATPSATCLERDQEFTVEPYGVEMMKVMSPAPQRRLQHVHPEHRRQRACTSRTSACCRRCATGTMPTRSRSVIHEDCVRRVGAAVAAARATGSSTIDVVQTVARYVPVTLGPPIPRRSGGGTAGILRADPRDARRTTGRRSTGSPRPR